MIESNGRGIVGELSASVAERLSIYCQLLLKWQAKINLVAPSTLDDVWRRHFWDSYQLIGLGGEWSRWVDLGSGAGFPGMVVALAQNERGGMVHLIEADKRKAAFLREVSRETGVPVEIHVDRIERALPALCNKTQIDVVSARALAPMSELISLAWPALEKGALGLFLKGKGLYSELTDSSGEINFKLKVLESRSDPDGKIVVVRRYISRTISP